MTRFQRLRHRALNADAFWRAPAILGTAAVIVLFILAGCATIGTPFATPPDHGSIFLTVVWADEATIRAHCPRGTVACATMRPPWIIYAPQPRDWDDHARIEDLGHELLHALGATHGN